MSGQSKKLPTHVLQELSGLKAEVSEEILKWHSHSQNRGDTTYHGTTPYKEVWPRNIVIVLVLVLNFESFFCDLLASVCLVNKNGCKVQH